MRNYKIRVGTAEDLPFLQDMLYEAVFWDPAMHRIPMEEFFAAPDIAKILHEWHRRNGDFSFIAVVNHHDPVGAVWYRFFNSENHSFGYVNDETPEIGIAVSANYREKGIGTELMRKVIDHAKQIEIKQLSLSVDPHNFALKLYQKLGFTKVSESGTSWTLLKVI